MKNSVRTLGITAALAVMIPFSAYAAATSGSSTSEKKEQSAWSAKGGLQEERGGFRKDGGVVSQEVLNLLKLDQAAFNEKIKAGSTLAQVAEAQGVSRESLKSALTESFNKKLEEKKKSFADNLDKIIDSDLQKDKFEGRFGGGFPGAGPDFTAIAKVLGLTADQVKQGLDSGKSLADLATDKGVDKQKLIDAQKTAITNSIKQEVKDGKLTQEQADKKLADVTKIAESIVNGKGFGGEQRHGGGKGRGHGGEPRALESAEPSASS
ncbi:hypothetical protein [Cohnella abietis]|uniref:LysM domain-containing protein n=1 Tax=Cohnella abietis TaxID=2507935 RepID=A0A3T1D0P3_9BACL|nr:hypothetical protein [Cohnella abietis]BBI31670.1 hypothetical protein KCTCHS21_10690 [Cohnella abietis]